MVKLLSIETKEIGHGIAFCDAEDNVNYRHVEGVKNYYVPLPLPFGLFLFISKVIKLIRYLRFSRGKKLEILRGYILLERFTGNFFQEMFIIYEKQLEILCQMLFMQNSGLLLL